MSKQIWKPGTMIYPIPAVMVTCGNDIDNYNIITIGWTGTINSEPPMCYISVRPNRHSYQLIKESKEFVINLTTQKLVKATDWCGVRSGKDYSKFIETGLTPVKAQYVKAPLIEESPLNIECKTHKIIELGSHDMFMAHILAVHADETYINPQTGAFDMEKAGIIAYVHGQYYSLGKQLGHFGFSVKKRK